jgi:hypothetical protein
MKSAVSLTTGFADSRHLQAAMPRALFCTSFN